MLKKTIKKKHIKAKSKSSTLKASYTAKDIEVLEGLEPVRKRPGMYIGGTDTAALHHLVSEVLDNSMDEVVANYADTVTIKLIDKNTIEISDNGRGIPVDKHPKFKISAAEVILTTLHSGGKFTEGSYKTSGGLHGVGISVVNALSKSLTLEIARDRKFYKQIYSQGFPKTKLKTVSSSSLKKGTKITFTPDPEIFIENSDFNSLIIYEMAKAKAYLIPDVEIIWSCPKLLVQKNVPTNDTLHFSGGIKDYLKITTEKNDSIIEDNFYFNEKFNED
jgi:topoisomerase-4 subunit B